MSKRKILETAAFLLVVASLGTIVGVYSIYAVPAVLGTSPTFIDTSGTVINHDFDYYVERRQNCVAGNVIARYYVNNNNSSNNNSNTNFFNCIVDCGISSCSRNAYMIVSTTLNRTYPINTIVGFYYNQDNQQSCTLSPDQIIEARESRISGYLVIMTTVFAMVMLVLFGLTCATFLKTVKSWNDSLSKLESMYRPNADL